MKFQHKFGTHFQPQSLKNVPTIRAPKQLVLRFRTRFVGAGLCANRIFMTRIHLKNWIALVVVVKLNAQRSVIDVRLFLALKHALLVCNF